MKLFKLHLQLKYALIHLFIFKGDSAELWVTLNAMGYDYNLVQDEAALFKVNLKSKLI